MLSVFEPTSYCKYKVNDGKKKKLLGGTTKVTYDLYCISPCHNETLLLFYILWNLAARVVLSPTGGAVAVMQEFLFFIKDKQKSFSFYVLKFFIELQRKHFFSILPALRVLKQAGQGDTAEIFNLSQPKISFTLWSCIIYLIFTF